MDLSQRSESASQLPSVSAMGLLVSDHISAMIAYWDNRQICRFANNAYLEWFGRTREEMIDRITMEELLGPLYIKNLPYILNALKGERQIFEREIPLPGGRGSRHSLATYTPDIVDGYIRGFFVHVADVTPIKILEQQLDENRRQMLKAVIEAQESERATIAHMLREDVCQTLAFCQLTLQSMYLSDNDLFASVEQTLKDSLNKLNVLSSNLSPSVVKDFELQEVLEIITDNFAALHNGQVILTTDLDDETKMSFNNKLALFRIVESFLDILKDRQPLQDVKINISYKDRELELIMTCNKTDRINFAELNQFENIRIRTAYYNGIIELITGTGGEHGLYIRLRPE